jgi:flagellar basal body-associated protein FliL
MSVKLTWEIDEDEKEPREVKERQLPFSSIIAIITVFILALVAFGVWQVGKKEAAETEEDLRGQVQAALDRERQALLNNDGELFLT